MRLRFDIRRSYVAAIHDIIMAAISFVVSLYLRLGENFEQSFGFIISGTLIFTGICATVFFAMRLYRGVWRYASTQDLIALTKAVTVSILLFLPAMFLVNRLEGMPRSMIVINWFVLLALLGGPRFLYRVVKDKSFKFILANSLSDSRIPVILVGINQYSEFFLREADRKNDSSYQVVAILDEDRKKIGSYIHNIQVMGKVRSLPNVLRKLRLRGHPPQKIIISPDYLNGRMVSYIIQAAEHHGLTVARLPRLIEFKDNVGQKIEMRPIVIEDLLGRPQTTLDRNMMRKLINEKVVLVTGAGGSIGSEVSRQIAGYSPSLVILFDISEYSLYLVDKELEEKSNVRKVAVLGDVRDKNSLENVFTKYNPELVFHAAAIKHVPLAEINIDETVLTNVIGTKNVADTAIKHKAKGMVVISTDKAVNPSNVMGATKRLAESYIQALHKSSQQTRLVTVRFGNVLGSTGSVVPLFQKQLANGGPITVTHPEMTRYFMTIREAVELVIMASALGLNNDKYEGVFVLDMGKPMKIQDLAEQMITLAGLKLGENIKIEYSGIRPGEKLYEELFYKEEKPKPTEFGSIMVSVPQKINLKNIGKGISDIEKSAEKRQSTETLGLLKELVPEYKEIT